MSEIVVQSPNEKNQIPKTVTDIEGNRYNTVIIGDQVWMRENLRTTKLNDGTQIRRLPDTEECEPYYIKTPGYSWKDNTFSNTNRNGGLYNWEVIKTGKLAPIGWRIPSESDWKKLLISLGGEIMSTKHKSILSKTRKMDFKDYRDYSFIISKNDKSERFHFYSSGYRTCTCVSSYFNPCDGGFWCDSILPVGLRERWHEIGNIITFKCFPGHYGLSVRCILDSSKTIENLDLQDRTLTVAEKPISINTEREPLAKKETVYDIDGNIYNTIKIGNQLWIAKNLATTRYNDGTSIPLPKGFSHHQNLYRKSPAFCWFENKPSEKHRRGALYNWYAVNTGKLNPIGWHVPTDEDWMTLIDFCGGSTVAGFKLKYPSDLFKDSCKLPSNESGFSAIPAGCRYLEGKFEDYDVLFWSSSNINEDDAQSLRLFRGGTESSISSSPKAEGLSVRCLWDFSATDNSGSIPQTITDIDGNEYNTVMIGKQLWMVENLKTTRFNDGTPIQMIIENDEWHHLHIDGYCFWENNIKYKNSKGAYYNWHAVNSGKLAPKGWHIPSESEWECLEKSIAFNNKLFHFQLNHYREQSLLAMKMMSANKYPGLRDKKGKEINFSGFSGILSGSAFDNTWKNFYYKEWAREVKFEGYDYARWWTKTLEERKTKWNELVSYAVAIQVKFEDKSFIWDERPGIKRLGLDLHSYCNVRCVKD